MKVKELKEWLNDKEDNDYVCELEELGYLNELSLEYLRASKNPSYTIKTDKIVMEVTTIPPYEPKKMDFGKVTVCSKCGKGYIPFVGEDYKACCEGATLISIKKYTEDVKGEVFDNSKWSFSYEDINLVKDVNLDVEIETNIKGE